MLNPLRQLKTHSWHHLAKLWDEDRRTPWLSMAKKCPGTLFHFPTMMQPIVRFDLGLGYFSSTDNAARTRQMDGERGYGYGYRKAKQSNNGPTKLFVVCVQAFRIDVGPSQHKGINRVEIMV